MAISVTKGRARVGWRVGAWVVAAATCGCGDMFGDKPAHQPGTALGTFHVAATATTNDCGQGALGSTSSWEFDVKLSRQDGTLFWNNGQELISGALGADGKTFSFGTHVVVDMRTDDQAGMPPCSVDRADTASGTLDTPDENAAKFDGSLSYAYSPTADSLCGDLVAGSDTPGAQPVFAALPCTMGYDLTGTKTAD